MMRTVLFAAGAVVLFASLASIGTLDDPYAPNDWLFSHVTLAQIALDEGRIPLNEDIFVENKFGETRAEFQEQTGIARMTFYANTMWHFWNGLPLHPALVASVAALTGLEPETAARLPLGGIAILLLVYASADMLLRGASTHLAPVVYAGASAPLVLDLRTLMPSASLVVVALALHLMLRRQLHGDKRALVGCGIALALLPFWYYTIAYFVIALLAAVVLAGIAFRVLRSAATPMLPLGFALLMALLLAGVLAMNGALTSHVQMASTMGASPLLGAEASGDYESHLNRDPWRSALLYAQLVLLLAPLAVVAALAAWALMRRREPSPEGAVFAQWALGAAIFSLVVQGAVGVSFLNRSAIYLTPIAAIAVAWAFAQGRVGRVAAGAALAVGLLVTPALVATAAPSYGAGDEDAFGWMEANVPHDAVVYGSLDASSVLFREHGFHEALAFHPRTQLLDDFWYGTDHEKLVPYLASVEWFVLRDDAREVGFEEFGPLREPIGAAAYAKFGTSPDLHRVYDNGAVEVYRVGLAEGRVRDLDI